MDEYDTPVQYAFLYDFYEEAMPVLRPMFSTAFKDNKSLGVFNLEGIMPAKKGVPKIEVTFDINANGILSVSAKDLATGKEQTVTIQSKGNLSDEEVERMKREAEQYAAEDEKTKKDLETLNKIESSIYAIDNVLENAGDKLTDEDKAYLEEAKGKYTKMKDEKNFSDYDALSKEVEAKLFAMSSKLYGANADASQNMQDVMSEMFNGAGAATSEKPGDMFDGMNPNE